MHKNFRPTTLTAGLPYCLLSLLVVASPCRATEQTDVIEAFGRFGVSFYKVTSTAFKQSTLSDTEFAPSTIQSDLTGLSDKYKLDLEQARASAELTESVGNVVIKTAVIAGTASGVGTVPATLVASAASWGNQQLASFVERSGEESARKFLKESLQNWDNTKNIQYDNIVSMLKDNKVQEAKDAFDAATGSLSKLKEELNGTEGANYAEDLIIRTLQRTSKAELEAIGQNTNDIKQLSQDLGNNIKLVEQLADKTFKQFNTYGEQLKNINSSLKSASSDIADLQKAQGVSSQQVLAMQDIMYSQQPAAGKLYLIDHGAKPELTYDQRSKLRSYLTAQKQTDELVSDTAAYVTTAKQVSQIAHNLGMSDPNVDKAINYASVAQNAFANFATGNYVGAILSVTSVFGGAKPDPEQQRFNAIMGFLKELDKKLDEIIDLQKQTLRAIEDLSSQVAKLGNQLNNRLDHVDFELRRIADGLSALMWGQLVECAVAWEDATKDETIFDQQSLRFQNTQRTYDFVSNNKYYVLGCAKKLKELFTKIKDEATFGQPLSLRLAANTNFALNPKNPSQLDSSDLEIFLKDVYTPALAIFAAGWKPEWGHQANAFAFLSSPASDVAGLRQRVQGLQQSAQTKPYTACSKPTLLSWRLRSFFCGTQPYASKSVPATLDASQEAHAADTAKAYFQDPIVRDQLFTLAKWTSAAARPFDFWTGNAEDIFTIQDLGNNKGMPRGRDLFWGVASVLDIAIAQQAMLSGDLTAFFVYDLLWEKRSGEVPGHPKNIDDKSTDLERKANALVANENNPWLLRNVLMLALNDAVKVQGDASVPYNDAIQVFLQIPDANAPSDTLLNAGSLYMRSLFLLPDDAKFSVGDDTLPNGEKQRKVYVTFGKTRIEMPSVQMFRNRSLIYPSTVNALIDLRQSFADSLVDYDFLSSLSGEQRKRVEMTLFVGLSGYGLKSDELQQH